MVKRNQGEGETTFDPRMQTTLSGLLLVLLLLSKRIKDHNNRRGENTAPLLKNQEAKQWKDAPSPLQGKIFSFFKPRPPKGHKPYYHELNYINQTGFRHGKSLCTY